MRMISPLAPIRMLAVQAIGVGLCVLGLLAGTAHGAQLSLTWSDASTNEDGFKVERATGTTGAYGQLATVAAGTTGYVDATVTAGTTYCYRVRAYNSAGDSAYSNAACGTPAGATMYTVNVGKAGTGSGTVASSPSAINCGSTCIASVASGTSLALSATPATGSTFTGWSGVCTGTGNCALVVDGAKNLTATFAVSTPSTYSLSLSTTGTGSGTVTSNPSGISCGSDCSESYASGTSVTLTAAPAAGATFTGWSGACTGTGTCAVSMTAARSVTATFAAMSTTPDLIWQNQSTGQIYSWAMNGTTPAAGRTLSTISNLHWRIAGAGDTNGDGKADLVWHNTVTGDVYHWTMHGATVTAGNHIAWGIDVNWKIVATGDFNGDAKADIVWQHQTTRDMYFWFMNGVHVTSAAFASQGLGPNWRTVATGDFNGDAKADIVWHNLATGEVYVWLMNGVTYSGGQTLGVMSDLNWRAVGVGDMNADGKADIVWHNQSTGQGYVWFMNGTTQIGSQSLGTVSDTTWRIVAVGNIGS